MQLSSSLIQVTVINFTQPSRRTDAMPPCSPEAPSHRRQNGFGRRAPHLKRGMLRWINMGFLSGRCVAVARMRQRGVQTEQCARAWTVCLIRCNALFVTYTCMPESCVLLCRQSCASTEVGKRPTIYYESFDHSPVSVESLADSSQHRGSFQLTPTTPPREIATAVPFSAFCCVSTVLIARFSLPVVR